MEAIAGLEKDKEGFFRYDLPKEHVEELIRLLEIVEEEQRRDPWFFSKKCILDGVYDDLYFLSEELEEEYSVNVYLHLEPWQISLIFPEKELRNPSAVSDFIEEFTRRALPCLRRWRKGFEREGKEEAQGGEEGLAP